MTNISSFEQKSNSISLAKIKDAPFTIIGVAESNYEEGTGDQRTSTKGVKITTKEKFEGFNVLHTTRTAIVSKLLDPTVLKSLENGTIGPVKCESAVSASGKNYFKLVDA